MKNRTFHLAIIMTIGILASAIAVSAQASSWAVGTFIGQDPNNGNRIRLVIEQNGRAVSRIERNTTYGTVRKDRMTINGATVKLKKTSNGFRAVNDRNGQTIDYVRGNGDWNEGNNDWNDNNNNNQGGGGRGRVPDWAEGTFYSTKPNSNISIQMTISSNGTVRVSMNNTYIEGTINRETLTINGETSRIRKELNGISTISDRNGETLYYTRSGGSPSYPNDNANNNNQQMGKVPSWAQGTFYATNPQNGQLIEMAITSDGRATVNFGSGYYASGTVYKETLTINNETSTLKRTRNGISTVSDRNGERIEYTRR